MLPKELLEVRRFKGKVFPKFASDKDHALAEKIIKIFRKGKGRKYGEVLAAIKTLENAKNYRKVRAFSRVVERFCVEKACIFDISSPIEPQKVRMFLFERGYVTSKRERQRIVEYAAKFFNTTPEEIEKAMYADRDEELVLVDVRQITPNLLIKLYNLSLLQTAVFDCLRLNFWMSSNHKDVFRRIKWLGLMYEIQDSIEISGAASILKMTRRYGTAIAKLIPSIVKAKNWWIRAEIMDRDRIYILEIDDSFKHLFPDYDEKVEYDSSLEEEFARKIKVIKPDVEVIREPDVVKAGKYAFIPDFLIRKGDREVYVEIAGFWTPEYIKRKLEKVRDANVPLILIVREDYALEKVELDDVIVFSKSIPYNKVIKKLNEFLQDKVEFKGDVVKLNQKVELPTDYTKAGTYAIKRDLFSKIKGEIDALNPKKLKDVIPVLNKYDLTYDVLEAFGYKIRWVGLSEDSELIKV
ncbi:translation initiation factor IF-2 [Archaeoglobales archaeon]|nr:MAG: translation initiation factor IF-2 [Archaeoglobales archaeon]